MDNRCLKDVLFYIDEHMIRKPNGNCIAITALSIADGLTDNYSSDEIQNVLVYLLENRIITKTNPSQKQSFNATKINGFTSKGQELLDSLKDASLSAKIQNVLAKLIPLFSAGESIAECLSILL